MQNDMTGTVENAPQPLLETTWKSTDAVLASFERAVVQAADFGPRFVGAVLLMAAGFIAALVAARCITTLAEKFGLQRAAERSGLAASMTRAGVERTIPQIVGAILFWLLVCGFIVASCDILQVPGMTVAVEYVVAYIPKVLVATVTVVAGLLLSAFIRGLVATSGERAGMKYSPQLANGCYYFLVLMTFSGAFGQLGVKFELLDHAILIVLAAVALALGLSFGLGGREVATGILSGYYLRQRFQPGDHVRVAGFEGTIRDVGTVATVIETEENGMLNRRSIPNHLMLHEGVR